MQSRQMQGRAASAGICACVLAVLLAASLAACEQAEGPRADVASPKTVELPVAGAARFVKLEEVTESDGKAWASMAEFNLVDSTGAPVDRAGWTATADSAGASESARLAIDGNPKTLWHSAWDVTGPAPPPPHWLVVALGSSVKLSGFRYLPRQDGIRNGTIAKFRFYVSEDGSNWGRPVAEGDFAAMGGVGEEKVVTFAKQTANHPPIVNALTDQTTVLGRTVNLQIRASDADGDRLHYTASGLPTGLMITPASGLITGTPIVTGIFPVSVQVSDKKGADVTTAFQWKVDAPAVGDGANALAPGEVRFVRLEAVSEVTGQPWTSVAEFNMVGSDGSNLSREGWIASADSSDISDTPSNAIDGKRTSWWHSQWDGVSPPLPHSLVIDMGHGRKVSAFRYLPRQDNLTNGTIARFRFYTSVDGVNWGKPVVEGDFSSMGQRTAEKTVLLKQAGA